MTTNSPPKKALSQKVKANQAETEIAKPSDPNKYKP